VNARQRLRERLGGEPLLADGGMGTLLFSRGIPQRACLDELPTTRPDLIGQIHREYMEAGAELIETATFGANRLRLAGHGLATQAGRFNRRAAQVAREARDVAGRDVLVGGSIGPLGAPTRDLVHLEEAVVRSAFREQIDGLLEGGVDLLVIETFFDLRHLLLAIEEARRAAADMPVLASLTFGEEIALPDGTGPEEAAVTLTRADVDVIGVNCGVGPQACLDALDRIGPSPGGDDAEAVGPFRSIMPNAGLPQRMEGQFIYAAEPDYFGTNVAKMLAAGANIVGGCCGTTPAHVAAMRAALDALQTSEARREEARARATGAATGTMPAATSAAPRAPLVETARMLVGEAPPPTRLAQALAEGRFVVSVEIDPPRSVRIDRTIEAARLLQRAGVDVVNISDSAMARVRMGAMAVAFGIQHDLDLECLVHFTTRDRNLMAIESELLGAHALGVRNIIALTGDPPRVGDYPTGTGVWDVDSIGLIEILTRLNRGEDQAGSPIGQRAGFTIACALDPTAADGRTEWDRLERKLAAGAHLVMTQPLYDLGQVEAMADEARRRFGDGGIPVPVLLGVLPLQSTRHAEFLHNEVPGITIPDSARAALAAAGDRGAEVGLRLAMELVDEVGSLVAGTYIMPSFGRYEQAAELARQVRAWHGAEEAAATAR
jgi:homocysteine S-methyltransferase